MRELNKCPNFQDFYINYYETEIGVKFPAYFIEFLKKYAGNSTRENSYVDNNLTVFKIDHFCEKNDRVLADYGEGIKAKGMGIKIPFAFDYSQKAYCLCLDESDYGAVYLFTLTGTWNNVDGILEKVCDSFVEFINGLQSENELGYYNYSKYESQIIKELAIIAIKEDKLKRIESKLGFALPKDYIEFMKKYANSSVYENTFYVNSERNIILASFCTFSMIESRIDEYLEESELGDDNLFKNIGLQLPFAIDGGGFRFCISLNEKTYGQVFFLTEELLSMDEESGHLPLSNSFDEFINGLKPESEIA